MNLPRSPLMQAYSLFLEVAQEGFDWDSPLAAAEKVKEELEEVIEEIRKPNTSLRQQALKEEIGDLFLACSCLARHCNVNPDEAIIVGLAKFMKRYTRLKAYAEEKGISFQETSAEELSMLWQQLKQDTSRKN